MTGSVPSIVEAVSSAYLGQAWSELYKIIGDIDALASPLQNARKLVKGCRDFVMYPVER